MKINKKHCHAWINKVLNDEGISKRELYHRVGTFSNKPKNQVMKAKKLTSKQYERRYNFLAECFMILDSEI